MSASSAYARFICRMADEIEAAEGDAAVKASADLMNAAGLVLARRLGAEAAAMSAYQVADHYALIAPRRWREPGEKS